MVFGGLLVLSGFFIYKSNIAADPVLAMNMSPHSTVENTIDVNSGKSLEELNNLIELAKADGVLTQNEKRILSRKAKECELDLGEIIKDIEAELAANPSKAETEIINQAKKKGDDFEKFIAQKFPKKYYTIKEWAGDKYIKGVYAETTTQPDLMIETKKEKKCFSIECKWRKEFKNDEVTFASKKQLENYMVFQKKKNIPVFITLGIGGEPSAPQNCYILPLDEIKSNSILKNELYKYWKKTAANFYFDIKTNELK
ncbi:hypothetical protein ALGA_2523 [Labilibaculum antarcticum]|uniref:Uncharacterized protein n=2 Tax=Labilibaculum antarcticum TaxID=1717717 RepID=A0A1Y1CKG5_9BACT|nr:hypothetical protein ALGA_2523 [Labilibaculum antarcticum]